MAGKLVVGSKDCKIKDIIKALKLAPQGPANLSALDAKWPSLAGVLLEDETQLVKDLRRQRSMGEKTLEDIVIEIIREWTIQETTDATLDVLVEWLKMAKIKSYAEALEKFGAAQVAPPNPTPNNPPAGGGAGAASPATVSLDKKIRQHLPELLKLTKLYSGVTSNLYSKQVLCDDDLDKLNGIANDGDKNVEFYKIIQTRDESCYQHLLDAFEGQSGVLNVLKTFY